MPHPSKCSTAMKTTRHTKIKKRNISPGAFLFIGLTIFFCIELTLILTKGRPFHLFLIGCLLVSGLTRYLVGKFSFAGTKKIRQGAFIFIVVCSAIFIGTCRIPISTISITMRPIPETTVFTLRQFPHDHGDAFTQIYKAPNLNMQTVDFRLPYALRKQSKLLRLYFGNHHGSYDIAEISFGTQVLWQPVALTAYTGSSILQIADTEKTLNHFSATKSNRVRLASINHSRPMLDIHTDEKQIRRDIPAGRSLTIKLIWFLLYAGSSGFILWCCASHRLKGSINQAKWIHYLTK